MSLPHTSCCSARSNVQSLPPSTGTLSHQSGCAAWNLGGATGITAQSMQPALQDPFTYYKAFLDTDAPTSGNKSGLAQNDDGYTCHTGIIGAQDRDGEGGQQDRARGFPYHLAVRLSNRSTGAPLATIMEQGSYSTLNSRGSLLSLGRLSSPKAAENPSPGRTSHGICRGTDENPLQRIQEDDPQERVKYPAIETHAAISQDYARSHPILAMNSPIKFMSKLPQSPRSQISDVDHEVDEKKPNGFLRGVLQNVRAASRTRSRSSSSTRTSAFEAREDRPRTRDSSPHCPVPDQDHATLEYYPKDSSLSNLARSSSSTAVSNPSSDAQARSRKILLTNYQPPASMSSLLPLQETSLPLYEQISSYEPVSRLLSPVVIIHSHEKPASVRIVTPEPRDVAYVDATTEASTLSSRHHDNASAQLAFDGVPTPNHSASSLGKNDLVLQTSRNASFCSTMSTSYSGTVLGIDVDIQYEASHQARRSSSPMPV
jgi:hypothetical protein